MPQDAFRLEYEPSPVVDLFLQKLTPTRTLALKELHFSFRFEEEKIYSRILNQCPNVTKLYVTNVTLFQLDDIRKLTIVDLTIANYNYELPNSLMAMGFLGIDDYDHRQRIYNLDNCLIGSRFAKLEKLNFINCVDGLYHQNKILMMLARVVPTLKVIISNGLPLPVFIPYINEDEEDYVYALEGLSFSRQTIKLFDHFNLRWKFNNLIGCHISEYGCGNKDSWILCRCNNFEKMHLCSDDFRNSPRYKKIGILDCFQTKLRFLTHLHLHLGIVVRIFDVCNVLRSTINLVSLKLQFADCFETRCKGNLKDDPLLYPLVFPKLLRFTFISDHLKEKVLAVYLVSLILRNSFRLSFFHIESTHSFFHYLKNAVASNSVKLDHLQEMTVGVSDSTRETTALIGWFLRHFNSVRTLNVVQNEELLKNVRRQNSLHDVSVWNMFDDPTKPNLRLVPDAEPKVVRPPLVVPYLYPRGF